MAYIQYLKSWLWVFYTLDNEESSPGTQKTVLDPHSMYSKQKVMVENNPAKQARKLRKQV